MVWLLNFPIAFRQGRSGTVKLLLQQIHSRLCDGSGWRPVSFTGNFTVTRCDHTSSPRSQAVRDAKSAAAGDGR
jgi:hypothetical protein